MATETTTAQPPVPFLKLKEIAHEVRAVFSNLLHQQPELKCPLPTYAKLRDPRLLT